jgi:integral membrane protein (TIGR00529 family)
MAIIPAAVGFLPMMGGALISAPVVKKISKKINISNEKKAFINYWFRHVWEYTLPIYPGILVAANILRIPVSKVIIYNLIFTVSAIVLGLIFGISRVPKTLSSEPVYSSKIKGMIYFLFNLSPILLIIVLITGVKLDVIYSLIIGIVYTLIICRINSRSIFGFRLKSECNLLLLAFSVLIFKDMLGNCGIIERLPVLFNALGISKYLVIALLPFIVGLLTGVTVAAIGVSFPVLAPLIGNDLTLMALGYMWGYAGVLLTPIHLCLSLSKEYFNAEWKKLYFNELVVPVAIMLLIASIYALI